MMNSWKGYMGQQYHTVIPNSSKKGIWGSIITVLYLMSAKTHVHHHLITGKGMRKKGEGGSKRNEENALSHYEKLAADP